MHGHLNVKLTSPVLRIFVTYQCTNVEFPDDDIEMSKHIAVYIIQRDAVVIYTVLILVVHLLVVIQTISL